MDEEDMIVRSQDFFVTRTVIDAKLAPEKVVAYMKKRRTTGPVIVDLSQGGTQTIRVNEEKKLTEAQSRAIREILGMNGSG